MICRRPRSAGPTTRAMRGRGTSAGWTLPAAVSASVHFAWVVLGAVVRSWSSRVVMAASSRSVRSANGGRRASVGTARGRLKGLAGGRCGAGSASERTCGTTRTAIVSGTRNTWTNRPHLGTAMPGSGLRGTSAGSRSRQPGGSATPPRSNCRSGNGGSIPIARTGTVRGKSTRHITPHTGRSIASAVVSWRVNSITERTPTDPLQSVLAAAPRRFPGLDLAGRRSGSMAIAPGRSRPHQRRCS